MTVGASDKVSVGSAVAIPRRVSSVLCTDNLTDRDTPRVISLGEDGDTLDVDLSDARVQPAWVASCFAPGLGKRMVNRFMRSRLGMLRIPRRTWGAVV